MFGVSARARAASYSVSKVLRELSRFKLFDSFINREPHLDDVTDTFIEMQMSECEEDLAVIDIDQTD